MYPGYPAPHGYPANPYVRPPSGGTAITAAILALLGAAYNAFGAVMGLIGAASLAETNDVLRRSGHDIPASDDLESQLHTAAIIAGGLALMLGVGGVLLLARRNWGRILIGVACGCAVAFGVQSLANDSVLVGEMGASSESVAVGIGLVAGFGFPLVTFVLVMLRSTIGWVNARTAPAPAGPANPYGVPNPYGAADPYGASNPYGAPNPYAQQAPHGRPPYPHY